VYVCNEQRLCFPGTNSHLHLSSWQKGLATTFFGGKKTNWQWKNPGHRISGTLAFVLGGASV